MTGIGRNAIHITAGLHQRERRALAEKSQHEQFFSTPFSMFVPWWQILT